MNTLRKTIGALWTILQWLIPTGRVHVITGLNLRDLKPFTHPSDLAPPNINRDSRCQLELLHEYPLGDYLPGLSEARCELTKSVFKELIQEETYTTTFPMSRLHGLTASKCLHVPHRVSQPNMAAMGQLINDLPDLKGKSGQDAIDTCMRWGQWKLDDGIHLVTDSWHQRYYWCNDGGGHHMAVLCRELENQNKEWAPEVTVTKYSINLSALDRLHRKVSIFMTMNEPDGYGLNQVFEPLSPLLENEFILEKLGVAVPNQRTYYHSLGHYQLIFVDHSRLFSGVVYKKLMSAVEDGNAISFKDFLKDFSPEALESAAG